MTLTPFPSIFDATTCQDILHRLHLLSPETPAGWGKMNSSQMLAHLNAMFALALDDKAKRPPRIVRFMLRRFLKDGLVNTIPYKRNSSTAPEMKIVHQPLFHEELKRFTDCLERVRQLGPEHFEQREHPAFGPLSADEWSTLFVKHIQHHLTQFDL